MLLITNVYISGKSIMPRSKIYCFGKKSIWEDVALEKFHEETLAFFHLLQHFTYHWSAIKHLSNIYRTVINIVEQLLNSYRTAIELLSNYYQIAIESLLVHFQCLSYLLYLDIVLWVIRVTKIIHNNTITYIYLKNFTQFFLASRSSVKYFKYIL